MMGFRNGEGDPYFTIERIPCERCECEATVTRRPTKPPSVVIMCPACLWAAKRLRPDGPSIREVEPIATSGGR